MARIASGIDVGHSTAIKIRGQFKNGTFHVSEFAAEPITGGGVAAGWQSLLGSGKFSAACIGLTGRDLNLRYVRVPRVPDWQLRKLMRFEVEDVGGLSGQEVASDFNLLPELPEIEGEDVVVLAMAKESLLEPHMEGLKACGGSLGSFAPNALALYNSWLRFGVIEGDTVMVANIGAENIDVIISRGPDLLFARNLSGGSKLFDDAIAQRFGVSAAKAEEVKIQYATLEPGARYENSNQEKASRAIAGAAGQLQSLLQSTVLFCKSQLKIQGLKVDRIRLCGGGAALQGLPAWLSSTMGVPVELFDAFRMVEISGLDPEVADRLDEYKLEAVTALGLATMASDPESFSVEILPDAMKRRREFWGGTAFLAAAGILAVGYLAWDAAQMSGELSEMEGQVSKLQRDLKRAQSTHNQTSELLETNARLEDESLEYQALLGSGEQLARTLSVLSKHMPEEYWLSHLQSNWTFDSELGVERDLERPILRLEGRAREGTNQMSVLHEGFLTSLRDEMDGVRLKSQPKYDGSSFALDLTMLALPDPTEEMDSQEEETN
ncbi:MAG: Tfp pilus assembly PilM family ATPase [Candidatus Paceibacteria bacterium]|jgi:Tfp pilus assembly PilM family ATPase